jgi:F-type H+-transporting ATPase subunit epsilon
MTTLRNGEIAVYRSHGAQPERIAVTGGFAEVSDKGLTVLAESAGAASAAG